MASKLFLSIGEAMAELSQTSNSGDNLWKIGYAGDTLNTLWYVRSCLPSNWRCSYLTRLGLDRFSDAMIAFLEQSGIDTSMITRDPDRQIGLYAISLHDGERSFSYWRNQSAARKLADDVPALKANIQTADIVYFSGITLAILDGPGRVAVLSALSAARQSGKLTVFDPNLRPALWDSAQQMCAVTQSAARIAEYVLPSFDDEAQYFGDASPQACAARWLDAGAGHVVVKNGGGTMVYADTGTNFELDALKRVTPVDTTSAGDAFNGGFLTAKIAGHSTKDAMIYGHEMACAVISHYGALVGYDALPPLKLPPVVAQ